MTPELCENKAPRNRGIDALRILATLMVLILHVLNIGEVMNQLPPEGPAYWVCVTLFVGAFCAVNCYGLISGYVGVYARYRYCKLISLWLQIVFINLLGLGVAAFRRSLVPADLWRAFFPLLHRSYWYFTAYCGLYFLLPVLNRGLRTLNPRQARALFWPLAILFSLLPTLTNADMFVTQVGYSVIWLVVLYLLGACIRQGQLFARAPGWALLGSYCLSTGLSVLVRWLLREEPFTLFQVSYHGNTLISYTAPTILLCSIVLLVGFSRMNIRGKRSGSIIAALAPTSFGIYILHMQNDLRPLLFGLPLFGWIAQQNAAVVALMVLLAALALFLLCAAVEKLRQYLFRILRIQNALEKLEDRLFGSLWAEK